MDSIKLIKHYIPDIVVLVRLIISIILLILAYKLHISALFSVILLILSALITGLDVFISAVKAVIKGDYFNESFLISVAAIAAFDAGCFAEAVIFLAVFKFCMMLMKYVMKFAERSALELIPADNKELYSRMHSKLASKAQTSVENRLNSMVSLGIKIFCLIAVAFAIIAPLVSNMTYVMSVRRGAMLLAAIAPVSLFASDNLIFVIGHCFASSYNVFVSDDNVFDSVSKLDTVVFDKSDVITGGPLKISAITSPMLDKDSFLMAAAYTVFNSEQPMSLPVISAYNGEIVHDYVSDFLDIPGMGAEAIINGVSMIFGTKELMDLRGVEIDDAQKKSGYVFYLAISGKLAGSITFKENINPYAEQTVSDLSDMGIDCVLISSDSDDISKKTANILKITRYFAGCDTMKKLRTLKTLKGEQDIENCLMYISADELDYHTDADIDVKVGSKSEVQDISMSNIGIYGLPLLTSVARQMKKLSKQNILISLAVKLVLMVLAFTGSATLWFVILIDYAAGMFGVLNAVQISNTIIPQDEQM